MSMNTKTAQAAVAARWHLAEAKWHLTEEILDEATKAERRAWEAYATACHEAGVCIRPGCAEPVGYAGRVRCREHH